MSKPIIPMHSPAMQRAAVTRCGVFITRHPRVPSITVYNGCGILRIPARPIGAA
jgi:hypothetical protein